VEGAGQETTEGEGEAAGAVYGLSRRRGRCQEAICLQPLPGYHKVSRELMISMS
jgi:hypothetical protein